MPRTGALRPDPQPVSPGAARAQGDSAALLFATNALHAGQGIALACAPRDSSAMRAGEGRWRTGRSADEDPGHRAMSCDRFRGLDRHVGRVDRATVGGWSRPRDPGPRSGTAGAGAPLAGLSQAELATFLIGRADFTEEEGAADGLGPTMNLDSLFGLPHAACNGRHQPGGEPASGIRAKMGAVNSVPTCITANGPVREARFVRNADRQRDGGVHALSTLRGAPMRRAAISRTEVCRRAGPEQSSSFALRRRCSVPG